MIAGWIGVGLLSLLSFVMLSGRGNSFIAGYNAMSRLSKSQFDEKKLLRYTGGVLLGAAIISAAILLATYWDHPALVNVLTSFSVVYVFACILYANKSRRLKPNQ